ncbi:helix-turn-helix domain-containing protein [Ligilactobacillus sp. WILCCON 0076]|uniref:Helix-turn-helix domain-containing protein n=1 Tax=Ligilactobacillus ubinensis TaxID=2876789 RepID=A0A9X2FJX7_9LACO|nr:helix-turn-helix domain-containing protein [Ligilactobacillus ubinensis]MCP0887062.1 helix-turn-helix domain-containing protein [Ligilactobacillus ubinensis]
MSEKEVSELAKILADKRNITIIKVTNTKKGITIKEIAQELKVPVSQLYYPIKKLVEVDILELVAIKQVKNLQEYYYSSYKLNDHSSITDFMHHEENLNISSEWIAKHDNDFIKLFLYKTQLFLDSATSDIAKAKQNANYLTETKVGGLYSTVNLSKDARNKLLLDISKLISQAEKNDTGSEKSEVNFLVERW